MALPRFSDSVDQKHNLLYSNEFPGHQAVQQLAFDLPVCPINMHSALVVVSLHLRILVREFKGFVAIFVIILLS